MQGTQHLVVVLAILSGACGAAARGATVFSNLGAADTFITGGVALSVAGLAAGSFTTGATPYTFDSAELALAYVAGSADDGIDVSIMSNDLSLDPINGRPGLFLQTIHVIGLPDYPATTLTTAIAAGTLTLQPNTTYWLAAVDSGTSDGVWQSNPTGQTGTAIGPIGGPYSYSTLFAPTPAFRINGTAAPSVPLPSAAPAGLVLLLALTGTRKLRTACA